MSLDRVRLTRIGGILLVLGLVAALWFLVLSPRLSKAAEVSAQAAQLQTANLSLRNQYNKSLSLAEQAPQAAADAQRLFATMPQQAELPAVIEQLSGAATDAGIKTQDIQTINASIPAPVVTDGGDDVSGIKLAQMDVTVTADAKRPEALTFLDNLQGLDRALLVKSTQLQRTAGFEGVASGTNGENVQVVGSMFVLQSKLPDLVAQVQELLAAAGQAGATTPGATTPGATAPVPTPSGTPAPSAAPAG